MAPHAAHAAGGETGRRRRPSGEPPLLPRDLPPRTVWYAAVLALTVALWGALLVTTSLRAVTAADMSALRLVAHARTPVLTTVLRAVSDAGATAVVRVAAWATIAVLIACKRFQHLVAYLAALLAVSVVETVVAVHIARIRPAGIAILAPWSGYAHPSRPVAGLSVVLVGAVYTLAPAGRWRRLAVRSSVAVLACLCAARARMGAARAAVCLRDARRGLPGDLRVPSPSPPRDRWCA